MASSESSVNISVNTNTSSNISGAFTSDVASMSTSDLVKVGRISPMAILRRLPSSFTSHLNIFKQLDEKGDIDEIENKCQAKVVIILMEAHVMIDYTTLSEYILSDQDFQHLALPSVKIIDCKDFGSFSSSDNTIDDYIKLSKLIEKYYYEYDGFVVVTAVSKLCYAASYLSFMLENLAKCVVFTSSTTKVDHAFNDAKSNLISSLIIAGRAKINEVCVCFDRKVFRGNRTIRHDQSSHSAFSSPNMKALAQFGSALIVHKSRLLPTTKKGFRVFTKLFKNVIVLYMTPCTNIILLKHILCNQKGIGIVMSFYGAGNAPQSKQLKDIFKKCIIDNGCNIVVTTQCLKGHVNMSLYATGNYFNDIGLINGHDMTIEAIVAKLSYLIGKGLTGLELRNKFQQNIVGELTPMHLIKGRIVDYKTIRGDHHGIDKTVDNNSVSDLYHQKDVENNV